MPNAFSRLLSFPVVALMTFPLFGQDDDQRNQIDLPMRVDVPVVEFDLTGGFRMPMPKGFERTPRLRVFADGKVLCGRNTPQTREVSYQLSRKQLLELLDFIVNQQQFYSIDSQQVAEQIKRASRQVADAPTSKFTVFLQRGTHQCEVYALMFVSRQFPDSATIQQLDAIEKRLQRLYNRAQLGDDPTAEKLIKQINERMKKQHPQAISFELKHLVSAYQTGNGDLKANFVQIQPNADGDASQRVQASVQLLKDKPLQVEFFVTPIPSKK